MKFKISIIIPTYNSEKFIHRTLDSIINQSFGIENIEVIVVDDFSNDNTPKILDKYSTEYSNFNIIYLSENKGHPGIPRNIGMKEAKTDYLMFLDHDDVFEIETCKTLYQEIKSSNADIVSGTYTNIYDSGKSVDKTPYFFKNRGKITIDNIDEMEELFLVAPSIWTKIFKKSFIIENKIEFPSILGEDAVFVAKCLLYAEKIIYLSDFVACKHILSKNSTTNKVTEKYFIEAMISEREIYEIFKDNDREHFFKIKASEAIDFFLSQFLFSKINKHKENVNILKIMKWYVESCYSYDVFPKHRRNLLLFNLILDNKISDGIIYKDIINKHIDLDKNLTFLKKENKNLKLKIAILQTAKGWIKYKTLNILHRIIKR